MRIKNSERLDVDTWDEEPSECWCSVCLYAREIGLITGKFNDAPVVFPVYEGEWDHLDEGEGVVMLNKPAIAFLVDEGKVYLTDSYPPVDH